MNKPQSEIKVALVTGGSRGIGAAVVSRLKEAGWQVATCARTETALKNSPADLRFACDVSKADQVKAGIRATLDRLGRIDALVNNAGLAGTNPMSPDSDDDFWHQIVDVNLHGTYYFSKYVLPHLPDGSGRIVNIGSVLSLKGVPDATAYCAAKHAVLGLTRSLAHFASPRRITVNIVCPGWTRTDMAKDRMTEIGITEKDIEKAVPIARFVEPSEIAGAVAYLLSPEAGAMTGQSITVDGGVLA